MLHYLIVMTEIVTYYEFSNLSRLIKKSRKATQLVEAAEKLFLRFGLEKVSVEEICQTAQVSKMTFYRYFQNKVHLFLFIINRIMDRAEKKYYEIMAQDVDYKEKARQIVLMKIEASQDFSYQMLKDYLNSPYPDIKKFINQKTSEYFHLFLKDFHKARQKGEIRKNIKPEFILYILNRLVDIVGDENLLQYYASPQELTEELTNFFFFGILPANPIASPLENSYSSGRQEAKHPSSSSSAGKQPSAITQTQNNSSSRVKK